MLFDGVNTEPALGLANAACPERVAAEPATWDLETLLSLLHSWDAIDAETAERLGAFHGSDEGQRAVERVVALRSSVIDALESRRLGKQVPHAALSVLNDALLSCGCNREIVRAGDGYATRIAFKIERPADLLMPLATSAAQILSVVDPTRLKQCKEESCVCYFIDTSRNHTREWCSMQRCGNRQKVSRYYRRHRTG